MNDPLSIGLQIAVLLFSVAVHESAHGWVAWRCGDPTAHDLGRITLNPLRHIDPVGSLLVPGLLALSGAPVFGWARPVPVDLSRARDPRRALLLVSAAGPLSNFLLAGLAALIVVPLRGALQTEGSVAEAVALGALYAVLVNVSLALFNLLPIPPLDGFGVLAGLLPRSALGTLALLRRFGMVILLGLLLTGSLDAILRPAQQFVLRILLGR